MTNHPLNVVPEQGVDVTEDSPLPDIPDAGDDSQPIISPNPVDIDTADINADAALVAGTLNDDDHLTLYEQALDAYEDQDEQIASDQAPSASDLPRVQIYDQE